MRSRLGDLSPYVALARPYLWWLVSGWGLAVLTLSGSWGLLGLSGGFLTATALAGLIPETAQLFNVVVPAGGIRLLALVRTVSRWSERVVNHEATFRLLGRLRVDLYARLSKLSPRQLGLYHGAEVLNRLTRDVDLLDNLFIRLLIPIGASAVVLVSLCLLIGTMTPALLVPVVALSFLGLVALPLVLYWGSRATTPRWVEAQGRLRRALVDLIEGMDDTSLHRAGWLAQRDLVSHVDGERLADQVSIQRRGAGARAFLILVVGGAGWYFLGQAISLPAPSLPEGPWIVALTLLVFGAGEAMASLPTAWIDLPGTAQAARRISGLTHQQPQPAFVDQGPPLADTTLVLSNVGFGYDDQAVLEGLNLTLLPGEHLALMGSSGGGKTTLVRLLCRLEEATSGTITLGSIPLNQWDETTLRSSLSCAIQDPWSLSATIARNLRLAQPEASDDELWRILRVVGLADQVAQWPSGLETWVEEGGESLSGGQRRRLALARVLLRKTPITVLDEPTEGLETSAAVALVRDIRQELAGRTLLWVTHRDAELAAFERVCTLEGGRTHSSR